MKISRILLNSVLALYLMAACKEKVKIGFVVNTPHTGSIIKLDSISLLQDLNKTIPLSDALYNISAVNLETSDSSILSWIGAITEILQKDGKIYLLDNKFMSIKVFDMNGKYLYSIGQMGIGIGQFMNIQDMQFNETQKSIMVLCNSPRKMVEYSLKGNFIREYNLDFWASRFGYSNNGLVYFYVNQNSSEVSGQYNILLTDKNFNVKSRVFDFPKNIKSSVTFSGGLYSSKGQIFYNPAFSNSFYTFSNDTAKIVYRTDFGNRNIPDSIQEKKLLTTLGQYDFNFNNFVKTDNFIGFNYSYKNTKGITFYSLLDGKIITNEPGLSIMNKLFSNSLIYNSNDKLIMLIDISQIQDWINKYSQAISMRYPQLFAAIKRQSKRGNPLVVLFSLKSIK